MFDPVPLVSVVLTTHERPQFLPTALACYGHQTYQPRELIVVDDSRVPIAEDAVDAAGGRLIRVAPGTPLGEKLNRGVAVARGTLCQKMDDDDWYGPRFLESMVAAALKASVNVCRHTVACVAPYMFFDVTRWEIRSNRDNMFAGASLHFTRDAWRMTPFRGVARGEDMGFMLDQSRRRSRLVAVPGEEIFLAVRHGSHTWNRLDSGVSIDEHLAGCPLHEGGPEALLPEWALAFYRDLHERLRMDAPAEALAHP
jgi:glycosyltransferase involved in cell wall biosynthesis